MTVQTPARTARPIDYRALTEVLLLGGTALLLLVKWWRGQLDFYIHPRYIALTIVSALILLLMAGVRLSAVFADRPAQDPGWVTLLLALPLLLGTFVPAQPLGAGTLAGRNLVAPSAAAPASGWQPRNSGDPQSWNLLDWSFALTVQGDALTGQPADVVGFVFHDARFGPDAFYAARFVITCCAADGAAVGLPVRWQGGGALALDSWVRVRGTIGSAEIDGTLQPAILATQVEPVPAPDNPYLYP